MSEHRLRATLALAGDKISVILVRGTIVHKSFEAHSVQFSNPPIPLVTLKEQIGTLDAAQLLVKTRVPNTRAKRNAARDALCSTLELYRAYVEMIAHQGPDPASAIENGGMKVAETVTVVKPLLDAHVDPQGDVVLRAHAKLLHKGKGHRVFNWQYTLDGGKTWIAVPSTPYAQTSISGLPSLTTCGFRVSVTAKGGQTEWTQPVSLLVVH